MVFFAAKASLASSRSAFATAGASLHNRVVARAPAPAPAPALAAPPLLVVEAKQGGGKLKTKKAASKRIKVTATGKVMVRKAGKQHINEKMSSAKLNEKSKMARVPDRELPNVIKCLPYAGISK